MGLNGVAGSWLEGTNPLVSTAVGALAFWVLGAVVGLCVRSISAHDFAADIRHVYNGCLRVC